MAGIFIVSSERSGSNLLKSILSAHTEVSGPVVQQLFASFRPLLPFYGPLEAKGYEQLQKDLIRFVNLKATNFEWPFDFELSDLAESAYSFGALLRDIYQAYANCESKAHFVDKENNLFDLRDLGINGRKTYIEKYVLIMSSCPLKVMTHHLLQWVLSRCFFFHELKKGGISFKC